MKTGANFLPGQRHVVRLTPEVALAFRYIPPGEFRLGSRGGDYSDEEPVSRVRLARGFWLGETAVTQGQFGVWTLAAGEKHRNDFEGRPDHPAENLDWRQAVRFCEWLTATMAGGKQFPVGVNLVCLPTECEWEYGCRAGSETEYYNGDGEAALALVGWYSEEWDSGSTHAVGQKSANEFGLYDMHGNVWEWCHDVWEKEAYRRRVDGEADAGWAARRAEYAGGVEAMLSDSRDRVIRGGSWIIPSASCRAANRDWRPPDYRIGDQGFRVCLAPGPAAGSKQDKPAEAKAEPGAGDGGRGTSPESDAPGAAGAGHADWGDVRLPRRVP